MKGLLTPVATTRAERARLDRRGWWAFAAIVAALAIAPLFVYPVFLMKLMCFTLLVASFSFLLAQAGLLSFGHAAFFGTGAFLAAHASKAWGLDPLLCLAMSVGAAAVLGAAVGWLAIRRKGIYFSMITLALAEMVAFAAAQAPFTGGENGLQDVPRGRLLGLVDLDQPAAMYAFVLVMCVLGVAVLWRVVRSPFGHVLQAIRDHEARATSLGYPVDTYKVRAFVVSAAAAGLAGGLNALVFQLATLADVGFQLSGEIVLMALLGGVGSLFGPLAGAAIVIGLESALAESAWPVPVVTGLVFIACVLFFRRGLLGELLARRRRS